jgi:hypothetical protein
MLCALKIIGIVLGGAIIGAVGFSRLAFALLRLLLPQETSNSFGLQMLFLFLTGPFGACYGAMFTAAIFHKRRSSR